MSDATCKTCPFWWYRAEDGRLVDTACRRNPPRLVTLAKPGDPGQPVDPYWTVWPAAQPDEWCGEHPLRQRDRLAAMAMQGMCATPSAWSEGAAEAGVPIRECIAVNAYLVADAMLAARGEPR